MKETLTSNDAEAVKTSQYRQTQQLMQLLMLHGLRVNDCGVNALAADLLARYGQKSLSCLVREAACREYRPQHSVLLLKVVRQIEVLAKTDHFREIEALSIDVNENAQVRAAAAKVLAKRSAGGRVNARAMASSDTKSSTRLLLDLVMDALRVSDSRLNALALEFLEREGGMMLDELTREAVNSTNKPRHRVRLLQAIQRTGVLPEAADFVDLHMLFYDPHRGVRAAAMKTVFGLRDASPPGTIPHLTPPTRHEDVGATAQSVGMTR